MIVGVVLFFFVVGFIVTVAGVVITGVVVGVEVTDVIVGVVPDRQNTKSRFRRFLKRRTD